MEALAVVLAEDFRTAKIFRPSRDVRFSAAKCAWHDGVGRRLPRLVGRDRLVVIIHPDHPWVDRRGTMTLRELAHTSLVERELGFTTRRFLDQAAASAGVDMNATPIAQLSGNAAIVAAVAAGLGPAVLSNQAVRGALMDDRVLAVPVAGGLIERAQHAVWLGGPAPRAATGTLVDVAASASVTT